MESDCLTHRVLGAGSEARDDDTFVKGSASAHRARRVERISIRQAAAHYEVSLSSAVKLMRRLRETGSVKPERIGGHRRPVLEPHQDQDLLRSLVEAKSGITLAEIQAELRARAIEVQALSTATGVRHAKLDEPWRASR